jgi:putative radical SAM enzyme (TIGR03279 family)
MTALKSGSRRARAEASNTGVIVRNVAADSPAARAGLRTGDTVTHIDSEPVTDFLDFYMASFSTSYRLTVVRGAEELALPLARKPMEETGIEIETGLPRRCNNRCVFCFVDQLPPGLRDALYLKDEDYRLSFLHGSYLTLTNLAPREEERIVSMHLSPLYVSVHATDEGVRAKLLGTEHRESILAILDRLGRRGIRFHTQVVVVPGFNDGEVLEKTLEDLCDRHETVLSVSVVPVGLTCYRQGLEPLECVSPPKARELVRYVKVLNTKTRETAGRGLIYASDEMLLLSGSPVPAASYYDDYPQIENGVGLLRMLVDSTRGLAVPGSMMDKRLVLVTGRLAAPCIKELASVLEGRLGDIEVVSVANSLFGPTVTVSGLIPGRDILEAVLRVPGADAVVLPPNVVNGDGVTLDDMTVSHMSDTLGVPVVVGDYDMKQTMKRLDVVFNNR